MSVIVPCFTVKWRDCPSQFHGSLLDGDTVTHSSIFHCQMAPMSLIVAQFNDRWRYCHSQFHVSLLDGATVTLRQFPKIVEGDCLRWQWLMLSCIAVRLKLEFWWGGWVVQTDFHVKLTTKLFWVAFGLGCCCLAWFGVRTTFPLKKM